jgi:hypothetical protein
MTKMTLDEIIERLKEYRGELGGDCEVRLMVQKQWPFECGAIGVVSNKEIHEGETGANLVYIVEGDKICYGVKSAWDVVS